MTWFKVDDSFYRSRKVRRLGRDRVPCVGLWTLCGDWSADNLSDGFVPWEVVEDWDPDHCWAKLLIDVALWFEMAVDGEKGIRFHDWDDWQPTREQVTQRRKTDAERRARWREQKKARDALRATQQESRGASHLVSQRDRSQCDDTRDATVTPIRDTEGQPADQGLFGGSLEKSRRDTTRESRPASALPDPTRPDPKDIRDRAEKPASRKRPALPMPVGWKPNDNHGHFARTNALDIDHEARQFRAHADANDRRQANWDAAFRQWLGNAVKWGGTRHLKAASGHAADPANGIFWEQ